MNGDVKFILNRVDAVLKAVANVDILSVTEQRSVWIAALSLAAALHLRFAMHFKPGLAFHLAAEIGVDLARRLATRVALRLAGGRR